MFANTYVFNNLYDRAAGTTAGVNLLFDDMCGDQEPKSDDSYRNLMTRSHY